MSLDCCTAQFVNAGLCFLLALHALKSSYPSSWPLYCLFCLTPCSDHLHPRVWTPARWAPSNCLEIVSGIGSSWECGCAQDSLYQA